MQIFRPYKNHKETAKFLDDKRLGKQIVEGYQICEICLIKLGLIQGKLKWFNHPIVQEVYNQGKPFLPALLEYMVTLDNEWKARGFNRKKEFSLKIQTVINIVFDNIEMFSISDLPEFFCGDGIKSYKDVFDLYKQLLYKKWNNSTIPVRKNKKLLIIERGK